MTDEFPSHKMIGREYALHMAVNDGKRSMRQMNRDQRSNCEENFFSIFKRGLIGAYHQICEAHLHRYCREFDFRYNTCSTPTRIAPLRHWKVRAENASGIAGLLRSPPKVGIIYKHIGKRWTR